MGKIKIHEIAKKLGVNSKEVVEKAIELGMKVKSHMSSVNEDEAKKIESKFSGVKKEIKEKKETPVIIRREVIVTDTEDNNKKQQKIETKKQSRDVGFIERERKTDYNIVYRNKPNRPLTVSELFGTKTPEKLRVEQPKVEVKPSENPKTSEIKDKPKETEKPNVEEKRNNITTQPKQYNNQPSNNRQFNRDGQNGRSYNNNYSNGNT